MREVMDPRSAPPASLGLRSERGFALMEAIVSCAVIAIVALAVLSGIDGASGSAGREQARAVASTLAEQDQERLRGLSVDSLDGLDSTTSVTVDKATYQVRSQAEWVTDDQGGTPSCGNSSKNNEYLHITSTVTSNVVGTRIAAVKLDSLMAPSVAYATGHGVLGVKVMDRNGTGLPGINVSAAMTGYAPPSTATDASGCAVFRQLPVGTYTVTLNQPGYVGTDLTQQVTAEQKVSAGTINFRTLDYDRVASVKVDVKTTPPGTSTTQQVSKATTISLTNAQNTGLLKGYDAQGQSSLTVTPLFPFKSTAYAFFTGRCGYESPDQVGNANYFANYPGAKLADPTAAGQVTVLQPPFNIRVDKGYSNGTITPANVRVFATLTKPASAASDSCIEPPVEMTLKNWPATGWGTVPGSATANWVVQKDNLPTAFDPGMPYGTYKVCIQDTATGRYVKLDAYENKLPGGTQATTTITKDSGWTTTSCV
jgi:type II secretory pathway pseudopilin PulG